MVALISPDVEDQPGEAVDDRRGLVEPGRAVHEPQRLDPASDPVEVVELRPEAGEDRQAGLPGGLGARLDIELATDLPLSEDLGPVHRPVPRDMRKLALDPNEVELERDTGRGSERLGKLEPELRQPLLDPAHDPRASSSAPLPGAA
jgi:hypothetical protein